MSESDSVGERGRLEALLRSNEWFMEALRAARAVSPPDWYVGGGVLRTLVWDALHNHQEPTPLADVDLAFFDPDDLSAENEQCVEAALKAQCSAVPWEARNQAAVHLWYEEKFGYPVKPLTSTRDGITTWPETATAVAVQLNADDSLNIYAPCGLTDLLSLTLRRNPRRVTREIFSQRLESKQIARRWSQVRVVRG